MLYTESPNLFYHRDVSWDLCFSERRQGKWQWPGMWCSVGWESTGWGAGPQAGALGMPGVMVGLLSEMATDL